MSYLYNLCKAISFGVFIGFLCGGLKIIKRREYSETQKEISKKMIEKWAAVLKYITFLLLILGLIWCCFFLIMAIVEPGQAEYANNISELIVAVLTVISIIFAFVEFLRRAG